MKRVCLLAVGLLYLSGCGGGVKNGSSDSGANTPTGTSGGIAGAQAQTSSGGGLPKYMEMASGTLTINVPSGDTNVTVSDGGPGVVVFDPGDGSGPVSVPNVTNLVINMSGNGDVNYNGVDITGNVTIN
jgi:hypothetical protein